KRLDAPCAPAEERQTYLFPTVPAHRPSFFSYLSPQEFVDVSNQMYIVKRKETALQKQYSLRLSFFWAK
ncbi:hypothetical protein, partial [Aneurinibacillus migulanus]|uniref:hypothetical protein n=1 Tax=Aneurinibacillus migulanus TaxID=47500 RepID=UPI002E219AE8|nr:hypothetical protein [Aneurinibacillus migulanus]